MLRFLLFNFILIFSCQRRMYIQRFVKLIVFEGVKWRSCVLNRRPFTSTSTSSIQPSNMVYPIISGHPHALQRRMVSKPRGCVGGSATAAESGPESRGGWSAAGVGFPRKKFQLHRRPSSSYIPHRVLSWKLDRLFVVRNIENVRGSPFFVLHIVCESLTLLLLLSSRLFPFALARTIFCLPPSSPQIRGLPDIIVIQFLFSAYVVNVCFNSPEVWFKSCRSMKDYIYIAIWEW